MSRTPEQKVNDAFARVLSRHWRLTQFLLQRIESTTGAGVPDIYLQCPKESCWIESKATTGLREEQINWHINHVRAGGRSYVLARRDVSHMPGNTPTPLYLIKLSLPLLLDPTINRQIKSPHIAGISVEDWIKY